MWRHSMQLSLYEQQCLNCCRGYSTQLKLLYRLTWLSYVTFPRCTFVSPDLGSLNSVNTSPPTAWMRESGDRMKTNDIIKGPKHPQRPKCSATMNRLLLLVLFTNILLLYCVNLASWPNTLFWLIKKNNSTFFSTYERLSQKFCINMLTSSPKNTKIERFQNRLNCVCHAALKVVNVKGAVHPKIKFKSSSTHPV